MEAPERYHQINLQYPGLRLLNADPLIFAIDAFASASECNALRQLMHDSTCQPSATAPAQESLRTSTTVFPAADEVRWLRERIATATNVALSQLEPTKLTRYKPGEFFKKHTDASFLNEKMWAYAARLAGVDEDGVQDPCSWPSRFCTLFLYLNDVDAGGRTCFRWLDGSGSMPGDGIFSESLASLPSSSSGAGGASGSTAPPLSNELSIVPRTGLAIVHFPSTRLEFGCIPDPRTMHDSEVAVDDKWIVQQFIWPVPIALHPLDRQGSTAMPSWHPDVLSEWEAIVSNAAVNASNTKTRAGDEIRSEMA